MVAGVVPNVTTLPPTVGANPVPWMTKGVPGGPDVGVKEVIRCWIVNGKGLLATPLTVTTTLTGPATVPAGTAVWMLVSVDERTVAGVSPNLTWISAGLAEKPVPVIVTGVPAGPAGGLIPVIVGGPARVIATGIRPMTAPSSVTKWISNSPEPPVPVIVVWNWACPPGGTVTS